MHTSTLEPFTILATSPLTETNNTGEEQCGCGCEVSLTQLALPQDARGYTGDGVNPQSKPA